MSRFTSNSILVALLLQSGLSWGTTKNLNLCIKPDNGVDTQAALVTCQATAAALNSIQQDDVNFQNAVCQANAKGVAMGVVSDNCGIYDVVLSATLNVN